jgi:DNA-binding PadR family transcriptional regulator
MLDARTAVLLALRQGPAYGRGLVRRIREASGEQVRFAEGSVYPALRKLARARLVRSWMVVPGRRKGGRARTYYELTERGVRASEAAVAGIAALLGLPGALRESATEIEARRRRIALGAELSETALLLKARTPRVKARGAA